MNFPQKLVHLLQERFLFQAAPLKVFQKKSSTSSPERYLTINELKDIFYSLKMNKSIGADEISFNVIKNCFGELIDILTFVFHISLQIGIFLDPLNIVTWSLETLRKLVRISNYRPNSMLPCFSKILERIMYKRL